MEEEATPDISEKEEKYPKKKNVVIQAYGVQSVCLLFTYGSSSRWRWQAHECMCSRHYA